MVVLGGMGSISGAAIAAVLLTVLPELLRQPTHVWPLVVVLVAAVLLLSRGRNRRGAVVLAGLVIAAEIARSIALARGVDLAEYRMIIYALLADPDDDPAAAGAVRRPRDLGDRRRRGAADAPHGGARRA